MYLKQMYRMFILMIVMQMQSLTNIYGAIVISSGDTTVTTTTINIEGTASQDVVRGIWYEVYPEVLGGVMSDYGALKAKANWSITVRHLKLGKNKVIVYGADSNSTISSDSIIVTLVSDFTKGSVRPRPIPSEIWFGGLSRDNPKLVQYPDQWTFTQKYVDGIMFHSAYSGFWTGDSRSQLAGLLESKNMRYIEEFGDGISKTNFKNVATSPWYSTILSRENTGVFLTSIGHDFHPEFIKNYCLIHPEWSEKALIEWFTGETYDSIPQHNYPHRGWRGAFSDFKTLFPFAKISQTRNTVSVHWDQFPSQTSKDNLAFEPLKNSNDENILVNGETVSFNFDYKHILDRLTYSGMDIYDEYIYMTDFPWIWMNGWVGGSVNYLIGSISREKTRAYEKELQKAGAQHVLICNTHIGDQSTEDGFDLRYKNESLRSLYLYQIENGRANKYNFESWYIDDKNYQSPTGRPYSTVPESKDGTYSNLARDAIRYLKGIKNESGELQELKFSVQKTSDGFELKLTNNGDIACLPAIVSIEDPVGQSAITYKKSNGENVTARIKSEDGLICYKDYSIYKLDDIETKLLQPGESYSVFVTVNESSNNVKSISFEAFWNPQDPTGIIRDKIAVDILATGIHDRINPLEIKVYPNPVISGQEINISTASKQIHTLKLSDISNRVVWFESFEKPVYEFSRPMGNLARGIYFLQIKTRENSVQTKKIVVQ